MATADEILAAEVGECDDILTVDLDSRIIIIPPNVTNIGVESDDKVRKLHFQVPRYYCDVDLFEFETYINYINADGEGDLYYVRGRTANSERIRFDWVVGRNAVNSRGNVSFIVCLKKFDNDGTVVQEFNTTIATLPVLPGLETGKAIVQEHIDLLEEWRSMLFDETVTINMLKSVYDPQGKNTDIFAYVDEKIGGSLSVVDAERFETLIGQGG